MHFTHTEGFREGWGWLITSSSPVKETGPHHFRQPEAVCRPGAACVCATLGRAGWAEESVGLISRSSDSLTCEQCSLSLDVQCSHKRCQVCYSFTGALWSKATLKALTVKGLFFMGATSPLCWVHTHPSQSHTSKAHGLCVDRLGRSSEHSLATPAPAWRELAVTRISPHEAVFHYTEFLCF